MQTEVVVRTCPTITLLHAIKVNFSFLGRLSLFFQGSPSSSEVKLAEIEHLVVEVRSALNYQTDVLKEEIRALSVMHEIELYTTYSCTHLC